MTYSVHGLPRQDPVAGFTLDADPIDAERLLMPSALLADRRIAYIHAHNAAHGCFAARIERN